MRRAIPSSIFLALIQLLFCLCAHGQLQSLKFITYTTNNGLLHNYTKKCVEDKKGFIWVVSETGLSRFDGVNFENFQHKEDDPFSLPHNTINDIAIDGTGKIWLATDKGLCYYNASINGFTSIDILQAITNSPRVLALTADEKKRAIWFMTEKGLFQLDESSKGIKSTSCSNPSPTQINQLYLSSDNRLWIALYRNGFIIYDIDKDQTNRVPYNWITCFYEGPDHIMWMGNWQGDQLNAWNMLTGQLESYREINESGNERNVIVSTMAISPFLGDSILLLSTKQMGIRRFNTSLKKFTGGYNRDLFMKYSLPSDFINFIYSDSHGILWACTWNGLSKMNALEQQFRTIEIPFLNPPMFQYYNLIEGIVSTGQSGMWWLGVNGAGLILYDVARKQMQLELIEDIREAKYGTKEGAWIEFLIQAKDGTVWAGNDIGIGKLEGKTFKQYEIRVNHVRPWKKTIAIALDNTFWISTYTHLVHFYPENGDYQFYAIDSSLHDPLPDGAVAEAGFCSDGMLWTGTNKGLFRFDTHQYKSLRIELGQPGVAYLDVNTINSLVTDGDEIIYLGTNAGLGIYNIRSGQFQLKGRDENVYPILWKSMLRDKAGNIWIYTANALYRYNPVLEQFSKFTTENGIYNFSSDPTHLFSFNNNFYIGYRGAFTEFDPLKVNVNETQVKPLITSLSIGNQLLKIDPDSFSNREFLMSPHKKNVSFHFTGIDYTNSDKITFSYKLNGETEWHNSGNFRSVTYNNLEPGHYVFQLKARNSSGLMANEVAVFQFYVVPTLLQRWWFWPLMALVFVCIVILLANRRVKKIRAEERLKTETNKMMAQLENRLLRSQMNPHFIFNSLNSIQKYIWENKEEDAAEYLAQFAKLIRAILENSRKEFISLREELDVLKLYIDLEHRRSNGKFDYRIQMEEALHPDEIAIPPLLLQPYIENAIWHGVNKKAGHGHIEINVRKENHSLEFIIDDDGVGRNFNHEKTNQTETGKTSMGSEIALQRVRQLQTKSFNTGVQVVDKMENGTASGTTVIVTIPIKYLADA